MPEVNAYIEQGNRVLGALGFTEHSRGHAVKVAETAGNILEIHCAGCSSPPSPRKCFPRL